MPHDPGWFVTHLVLNTGRSKLMAPSRAARAAVGLVAPVVAAGGGPVPRTRLRLHIVAAIPHRGARLSGGAAFTVELRQTPLDEVLRRASGPLVAAAVCWDAGQAEAVWAAALDVQRPLLEAHDAAAAREGWPAMPAAPWPWVAVSVFPASVRATAEELSMLPELGFCVAVALLERARRRREAAGQGGL